MAVNPSKGMLVWESILTFLTVTSAGLGLANLIPARIVGFLVIIVQGLNAGTLVFKTGQWSPALPVTPVVQVAPVVVPSETIHAATSPEVQSGQ